MMYIHSPLFRIQIIVQLILTLVFALVPMSLPLQAVLCGIMLCTVGIPHGANDHLYRTDKSLTGNIYFITVYLGAIFFFLVLWWKIPVVAFTLFFVISFHHFGQSNFENDSATYLPSWLWGICVLAFPVLLHWQEALSIFSEMLTYNTHLSPINSSKNSSNYWNGSAQLMIVLVAIYILSLYFFERKNFGYYILQLGVVTLWYIFTPLLTGFITVFCLWHSLQSLRHQALYYQQSIRGTLSGFLKSLLPFSAVALLSFGIYLYFRTFNIAEAFILLSLITLPHVIVMHRLYGETHRLTSKEARNIFS